MTFHVSWEVEALDQAAGFLHDDPPGVAAVMHAAGQPANDPRPPESFAYGSPDRRRLRDGRYRIMYNIDEAAGAVSVWHLARGPARE